MVPPLILVGFIAGVAGALVAWKPAIAASILIGLIWSLAVYFGVDSEERSLPASAALGVANATLGLVVGLGLVETLRHLDGRGRRD